MDKSRIYLERVDAQIIIFPPHSLIVGGFTTSKFLKL